jgi:hypothetical protein
MEQSPFFQMLLFAEVANIFPTFMEAERSLPCSQQPATRLYPDPDESSLRPQTLFL